MGHNADFGTGRTLLRLLLLVALGCGTGTDGKPVAPPTRPEPGPAPPPPEPPGQPTGVQVVEFGQTFLVWEWDPVDDATSYEGHAFPEHTPPHARPPLVSIPEPTYRAEDLEPGTTWEFFVRAIRDTPDGRLTGPWSVWTKADTWGEPRVCTDERERARQFSNGAILVEEWDGTPFRYYFDEGIPASERADAEHFLAVAERLARRIEDQIGYPLFVVEGWIPEAERGFVLEGDKIKTCEGVRPGGIVVSVLPTTGGYRAGALTQCGMFHWERHIPDTWDGVLPHETFHLFGFAHSLETHPHEAWKGGIPMSVRLTNRRRGPRDLGVTFEDVDALRCVFPEGGP